MQNEGFVLTRSGSGQKRDSGYLVRFDDGLDEYVYAHWLEDA